MKKALQIVGMTLLIAVISLAAVSYVFSSAGRHADADPNDILAHSLFPYLKDGQTFRLTDAYPEAWDTAQVIHGKNLTEWEWRTLRAYDPALSQTEDATELLIFWRDGEIARAVRFNTEENGMPWFSNGTEDSESFLVAREDAIFRATLVHSDRTDYYTCVPTGGEVKI